MKDSREIHSRWIVCVSLCLCGFLFWTPGCMSLEQMAPPVEGPVAAIGQERGQSIGALARGRLLFITTCAKCHNVEPIARYSLEEWEQILPEMSNESKLNPQERQELRAYVLSAHQALEAGEEKGRTKRRESP